MDVEGNNGALVSEEDLEVKDGKENLGGGWIELLLEAREAEEVVWDWVLFFELRVEEGREVVWDLLKRPIVMW